MFYSALPSLIYTADTQPSSNRRGKVSTLLAPQEELMSVLISNLTHHPSSWVRQKRSFFGQLREVSPCTWKGVLCDSRANVLDIRWFGNPNQQNFLREA